VSAWVELDGGITVLTTCVDSGRAPRLSNGTFAGFATIPNSDPAKTVTVREQLSVQSKYVGDFWPLGFVIVGFAVALVWDKLAGKGKTTTYLAIITGFGVFTGAYYATALSNPSWGGPKAIGTLLVALFTATTGAVAAAVAPAKK
jgi:hypothetical protein